jgi:hypothetical protein
LDNAGEGFVSATKSFSAQTSARALLGFFEEKLEKLRKNLLGPPSGKVSLLGRWRDCAKQSIQLFSDKLANTIIAFENCM